MAHYQHQPDEALPAPFSNGLLGDLAYHVDGGASSLTEGMYNMTKMGSRTGEKRNKIGDWTQDPDLLGGELGGEGYGAHEDLNPNGYPPYAAEDLDDQDSPGASAFPMKVMTRTQYNYNGQGKGKPGYSERLQASTAWGGNVESAGPPHQNEREDLGGGYHGEKGHQAADGLPMGKGKGGGPLQRRPNQPRQYMGAPEEDRWGGAQKGGWVLRGQAAKSWPPGSWDEGGGDHEKGGWHTSDIWSSFEGDKNGAMPASHPSYSHGGKSRPADGWSDGRGKGAQHGPPGSWQGQGQEVGLHGQGHPKGGKGCGAPEDWLCYQTGGPGWRGVRSDWPSYHQKGSGVYEGKGCGGYGDAKGGRQGLQDRERSRAIEKGSSKGSENGAWRTNRWHKSAEMVGILQQDDHIFTKVAGPKHQRVHDSGVGYELSTICMVFDASLRCGGTHRYTFSFIEGELGPADGAGFVFDNRVRRRPLQQMRAVFMNLRGYVCLRRGGHVSRLPAQLPRLTLGKYLTLSVNLDWFSARFDISDEDGHVEGSCDVNLESIFSDVPGSEQTRSGFFGAVVTGNVTVGLY